MPRGVVNAFHHQRHEFELLPLSGALSGTDCDPKTKHGWVNVAADVKLPQAGGI